MLLNPCALTCRTSLAEKSDITVGVLEAGRFHLNDPVIDIPREKVPLRRHRTYLTYLLTGFGGRGAGNPDYDWDFSTTPQVHAAGRSINITRYELFQISLTGF
jgi:choline dehydrogenase-like flavoprotein